MTDTTLAPRAPRAPKHGAVWALMLTTEAPLHHGAFGGDAGNAVLHRRVPLAQAPDLPGVPAISGNALRGHLRRIVMRDLFARCDLTVATYAQHGLTPGQWDRLYAALANGGHLDSSETRTDPVQIRALRDALPPLSVFGASLYSMMLPGLVSVGWLWVRCRETVAAGLMREDVATTPLVDGETLVTELTLVRHIDRDEQDPASSGVTPMPVTVEALMPGVTLCGSILPLRAMTDVEIGVLGYGLSLLRTLGGKGGAGFGRLRVQHDVPARAYEDWLAADGRAQTTRAALIDLARRLGK